MTESEAKTKWCPFVRFNEAGNNRWTFRDEEESNHMFARCWGSECMAWRWKQGKEHLGSGQGYCGLAR